jgi:hypothetical protein
MALRSFQQLIVSAALALVCASMSDATPPTPLRVPKLGTYIGFQIDSLATTPAKMNEALQVDSALFGEFFRFPELLSETREKAKFRSFVASCAASGSVPMITLETFGGLNSYTQRQIKTFARLLQRFQKPALIRWNHEMNGSWYPWGQNRKLYIKKFREFSRVTKSIAPNISLVWAPNQGWGYPWSGLPHSAPSVAGLDTNFDGILTSDDDPYSPYYPGNKFVDWIGISFYHWGNGGTNGTNETPTPGKFAAGLGYFGGIKDFHMEVAEKYGKPIVIAETAAYFDITNRNGGTDTEDAIKRSWLNQLYAVDQIDTPSLNRDFPLIKGILWFEHVKFEGETSSIVDWTVSNNLSVAQLYRQLTSSAHFLKRPERVGQKVS